MTLAPGALAAGRGSSATQPHRQAVDIINGHVLELPDSLLTALWRRMRTSRASHYDRPFDEVELPHVDRRPARFARDRPRLHRRRRRRRGHRLGHHRWHDDLTNTLSDVSIRTAISASPRSSTSSTAARAVRRRRPRHARRRHHRRATATIRTARRPASRPTRRSSSLKVLDANGNGTISNIIAALDWVLANHSRRYNIRVVNLSVGAPVTESYWTDPLTLAAKRVVDLGIVVVAAAGNVGKNAAGQPQYGGDHRAGQRAVGADRRRVEHRTARSTRADDTIGELQLARSDATSTARPSPISSRPASAPCRWRSPRQRALLDSTPTTCVAATLRDRVPAVSER